VNTKKNITLLILLIIISSCNLNQNITTDVNQMFGILYGDTEEAIGFLKDDIYVKMLRNDYDSISKVKIQKYNSLTKGYLSYLEKIESQFIENSENLFFENSAYSKEGNAYLKKTKQYEREILKLTNDSQFGNRVSLKVGVYNVTGKNGQEVKHLDYIFEDVSQIGIVLYLKIKQKNILELQKDFINEFLIKPEPEFIPRKK